VPANVGSKFAYETHAHTHTHTHTLARTHARTHGFHSLSLGGAVEEHGAVVGQLAVNLAERGQYTKHRCETLQQQQGGRLCLRRVSESDRKFVSWCVWEGVVWVWKAE
jgi:hypothetical protein